MKTMMKKCGVFATFAAVLLVMVVTSCSQEPLGYQLPAAGMGSVRLIFNETIERATILPADASIDTFEQFTLTFTAVSGGGGTTPGPMQRLNTNATVRNNPINLVPGTYYLTVVAYLDADASGGQGTAGPAPTRPAAIWSSGTPLTITTGNTTSLAITLKPYDPATTSGTGTFAWTITNSISGTLQTGSKISLTTLAGGTITGWSDVDLTTDGSFTNAGVSIPSNYYYVDITLVVNGVIRNFRHVLHIYQNMTSTFTYEFTNAHIGVEVITFTPTITYTHPSDTEPTISAAAVSTNSNSVEGSGTAASPYVISLTDNDAPEGLTITVTNAAAFTGGIKYYLGSISLNTGNSLTIPGTTPFDAAGGPHQITVEGTVGATNGVPYYTEIFVKVVP